MWSKDNPTGKIALDPEKAEEGLAQLVMTVIELLRQLVERQAMRRVENGDNRGRNRKGRRSVNESGRKNGRIKGSL